MNSKCEVLLVLDLKDAFHSLRLSDQVKKFCSILPYFWKCLIYLSENAYGIKYISLYLATDINAILDCLETTEHCKAIMDDLLLFTPSKKAHMAKLEDLLKALLKNGLKILPKSVNYLRQNYKYMEKYNICENRKVCVKPLRSRIESILMLEPPKMPKWCRSFCRHG